MFTHSPPRPCRLAWYAQRGWTLPRTTAVIPNAVQGDAAAAQVRAKPVWRLVFYGRLEERKGIKIFVEAVKQLPLDVTSRQDFQVVFMGAEAVIDGARSTDWLRQATADFKFSVMVKANTPHDQAMEFIRIEGNLAVIITMVDVSNSACLGAGAGASSSGLFDPDACRTRPTSPSSAPCWAFRS